MTRLAMNKPSGTVIAFVGALLLSGGLVGVSHLIESRFNTTMEDARTALNDSNRRIANARHHLKTHHDYRDDFEALEQRNIVGEEPRLAWTEVLRKTTHSVGIPGMRFEMEKRSALTDALPSSAYNDLPLFRTRVVLNLDLRHEVQLFDFIEAMRKQDDSLFVVNNCLLQAEDRTQSEQNTSNVRSSRARCELDWITVNFDQADMAAQFVPEEPPPF